MKEWPKLMALLKISLCCSIEISPCLDPGYCVQKTMRSKYKLGEEKDAGLSKYMNKGLPLPMNTFAGIITWHDGVVPQRDLRIKTIHAEFLIMEMLVASKKTSPAWHTDRQKDSPLSHTELLLKPKCFSCVSQDGNAQGKTKLKTKKQPNVTDEVQVWLLAVDGITSWLVLQEQISS